MIKLPKTKRNQRDELNAEIEQFLHGGGAVDAVERGISGRIETTQPLPHVFDKKQDTETRTPVNEVIHALDERKKPGTTINKYKRPTSPRKKMIYDDFGQPLRWEYKD